MSEWDPLTGSLDFTTLRNAYGRGTLRPEDVVRAIYRRMAQRGEDHVWIHRVPEEDAIANARSVQTKLPLAAPLFGLPVAIKGQH